MNATIACHLAFTILKLPKKDLFSIKICIKYKQIKKKNVAPLKITRNSKFYHT